LLNIAFIGSPLQLQNTKSISVNRRRRGASMLRWRVAGGWHRTGILDSSVINV
jgi:hypothetical protein